MIKKGQRFQIEFKGRFLIDEDKISTEVAFKLLDKCLKKKHLNKTALKLIDGGFYVGSRTGIVQIKRKTFKFNQIYRCYVFKNDQKCVILVNNNNTRYYMSFIKFVDPIELSIVLQLIESSNAGYDDNFIDDTYSYPTLDIDISSTNGNIADDEEDEDEEEEEDKEEIDYANEEKEEAEYDFPIEKKELDNTEKDKDIRYGLDLVDSSVGLYYQEDFKTDFEKINYSIQSSVPDALIEDNANESSKNDLFRSNSKIDNLCSANFDDLFIEIAYKNKDVASELGDGSSYMFLKQYTMSAGVLFGVCESEEYKF